MTKNLFANPFYIVLLFFVVLFSNILLSVHFIPIMLAGTVFTAFIYTYQRKKYYSMAIVIMSFMVIEVSQGMHLFSLSLLSFLIYIFVIPKLRQLFSLGELDLLLFVLIFYLLYFIFFVIFYFFSMSVLLKVLLNIIVDLIIVGILF